MCSSILSNTHFSSFFGNVSDICIEVDESIEFQFIMSGMCALNVLIRLDTEFVSVKVKIKMRDMNIFVQLRHNHFNLVLFPITIYFLSKSILSPIFLFKIPNRGPAFSYVKVLSNTSKNNIPTERIQVFREASFECFHIFCKFEIEVTT